MKNSNQVIIAGLIALFFVIAIPQTVHGETTWTIQDSKRTNDIGLVSFSNATHGYIATDIPTVIGTGSPRAAPTPSSYSTTDGGVSWGIVDSGVFKNMMDSFNAKYDKGYVDGALLSPYPFILDENHMWLATSASTWHTSNGGKTWDSYNGNSFETHYVNTSLFFANDAKHGWSSTNLYSSNGGGSWGTNPLPFIPNGAFFIDDQGWVVADNGLIGYTEDGGKSWTPQYSKTGMHLRDIAFIDTQNGWIVGDNGTILYTSNGGKTWEKQSPSVTTKDLNSISIGDAQNIWVAGDGGTILHGSFTLPQITPTSDGITPETKKGGGSDHQYMTKPTFGIDHKTNVLLVEGGFAFNGKSFDITDNFWTPFDKQHIKVNQYNTFSATVYAEKQLSIQEFLFGIPEVGKAQDAELGIEIHYNYDGTISETILVQKSMIVDASTLQVESYHTICAADDIDERCVTTQISMRFLEPLQYDVMAIKAIDYKNRPNTTYLNDGFEVTGTSLNPMETVHIAGPVKYEGLLIVTQTAKYSDLWLSDDGREFIRDNSGGFKQINQSYERMQDLTSLNDRLHSSFALYKDAQTYRATLLLEETCPGCFESHADFDDAWTYEIPAEQDRLVELKDAMTSEALRAELLLE